MRMKTPITVDSVASTFWHYFCRIFGITTLLGSSAPLLLLAVLWVEGQLTSVLTMELLGASALGFLTAYSLLRIFPAWLPMETRRIERPTE